MIKVMHKHYRTCPTKLINIAHIPFYVVATYDGNYYELVFINAKGHGV